MSGKVSEHLYKMVKTSLKYLALDSKLKSIPEYILTMYQVIYNMTNDHLQACEQLIQVPDAILMAMDEDLELNEYLNPYKDEIIKIKSQLSNIEDASSYINASSLESSNVEGINNKARIFVKNFDEEATKNKLATIIRFIEENKQSVADFRKKLGENSQEYRDISDNIFLIAALKINEFREDCKKDATKRAMIFEEKSDIGYGKTMWDEYSYLLINNSLWPLTQDGKIAWSMSVLEFGQLKFMVDNDKKKRGWFNW